MTTTYYIALGLFVAWVLIGFIGWRYMTWAEWDRDRRIERARNVAFVSALLLSEKPEQGRRWTDEDIALFEEEQAGEVFDIHWPTGVRSYSVKV